MTSRARSAEGVAQAGWCVACLAADYTAEMALVDEADVGGQLGPAAAQHGRRLPGDRSASQAALAGAVARRAASAVGCRAVAATVAGAADAVAGGLEAAVGGAATDSADDGEPNGADVDLGEPQDASA
jgi:hypothetical protein